MEIVLLSIGKIKESWVQGGINLYISRLSHYLQFKQIEIPDVKNNKKQDAENQKTLEGIQMLKLLDNSDLLILLDEHGTEMSSLKFSDWLQIKMASGIKRLVFAIGGPYGFSNEVKKRANSSVSMSKMTFTHEMARLFAVEQIYRAMTILNNQPYHHE